MTRPLAIQLYTLREEIAADRDSTLRRIADIGYDAVEQVRPTENPKEMRALLDELGLTVWATHTLLHKEVDVQPTIDAARTLGTDRLIIPGGFEHERFTTVAGVHGVADELNGLAARVAEDGMRLGYHNHWWEFPTIDGRHAYELLVDLLDPSVFLEIDAYWAVVGGADVLALLGDLGDRVHSLHIKDGPLVQGQPNTAVGAGAMPNGDVVAAAPADTQLIVELDKCGTDTTTAVADSHAYLTTLLGTV